MSTSDTPTTTEMSCARHPGTTTYLRCARCQTPICPRCLVLTPVGAKCASCARSPRLPMEELPPLIALAAGSSALMVAAALGLLGTVLQRFVPFTLVVFPFVAGLAISEVVRRVSNHRRHLALRVGVGVGVALSYLILTLGDFFVHGPIELARSGVVGPLMLNVFVGLVENPFIVLFLICGIWVGVSRLD